MSGLPEVTLGEHTVPVLPQKHARLTNSLGEFVDTLAEQASGADSLAGAVALMGDSAYDLLDALVPDFGKRVPKWEFAGYGSPEAYAAKEYDERLDRSPTFPEILNAFEKAALVNRFDVFKALGSLVDPKMLKAELNLWISDRLSGSQSLPSISAGSEASPSSGTTAPTPPGSSDDDPQEPSITGEYVPGSEWIPRRSNGAHLTPSA